MSNPNRTVILKGVQLSFPSLFSPRAYSLGDEPKYTVTALFAEGSPAHKTIATAIAETREELWGQAVPKLCTSPLKEGDEKIRRARNPDTYAAYEGLLYLQVSSKNRVPVIDSDGVTPLDEETGRDKIYGGAIANVVVNVYSWNHVKHGPQTNASLRGVQFVSAGKRIGGGGTIDPRQYFEAVEASAGGDEDDWL